MNRASDPLECVQRVDAGAVLFDVWASSFDARQEELERKNEVLVRLCEELDRQVEALCGERDEMRRALRRAAADRRRGVQSLIAAKEEERRRILLDLRNDPLQALEAVLIRLESIRRDEVDGRRPAALEELEMTTMLCLGRLRRFLFELRSDLLDRYGIADTLRRFIDRTAEPSGLLISLENRLTHEPEALTRANLYRILQEAVVNVRTHARARWADVTMEESEGGILVTVRDDGIGFSPETMSASGQQLGLETMRLRAEASGGWFRVDSAPGNGTRVMSWVPRRRPKVVSPAVVASSTSSAT